MAQRSIGNGKNALNDAKLNDARLNDARLNEAAPLPGASAGRNVNDHRRSGCQVRIFGRGGAARKRKPGRARICKYGKPHKPCREPDPDQRAYSAFNPDQDRKDHALSRNDPVLRVNSLRKTV